MKTKLFFLIIMSFFISSCVNDDSATTQSASLELVKVTKYVKMIDDEYVMTINKSEAIGLGIDENTYTMVCTEVEKTNAMIWTMKNQIMNETGAPVVEVYDCTHDEFIQSDSRVSRASYPS